MEQIIPKLPSQTWDFSNKSNEQINWKEKKENLIEAIRIIKKKETINQNIPENLHGIKNKKSRIEQKGKSKPIKQHLMKR
jgi:hypothetical protein